ncbi:unnamed protein product [Miscanthus lutarioriparius]|uniref:Probable zinc-ribbon domain-containing protein n=1 Tax=Miscanthus lutarioriparius TaxID=422564 RepID=A0A811RPC8_9POAL|nr:unnamed protein product [Miscanthus lutarioriparius]
MMESGEIKMRFGRCPYCRTMIYQNPEAVIFFCSKCRTPIRGKNPVPTEQIDQALSRLEILSDRLRPFSRRTRRPSGSDSDSSVLRYGMLMITDSEAEEGFSSPRNACERQLRRRRRSLLGSQAFETSIASSGQEPYGVVAPSPLRGPAFNNELLNALDNLRGLIAAIEPASSSRRASAPHDAHLFRRLESQLARALHVDGRGHRRNASSTGSSSSSSGGYRSERRKNHCRPVLGGAPFLVCGSCSELLQAPATTGLPRGKVVRLRCGGCEDMLEMTAVTAGAGGSALHKTTRADPGSCNSGACGDGARAQQLPPQPLHRALGYSSPSPLLQSRRY